MSELQHPDSRAFELVADLYERARPEYPREAIEWMVERLGLGPADTVLDLGAGTGKLTRALLAAGVRVIAVEPGEAMLAELRRAVPGADARLGAAEQIPLHDDSVDAIAVGQAFHWFRHGEALPEMRRVLRPGGGVGLIWNERDQDDPLQRELTDLIAPFVPPGRPGPESWRSMAASTFFGALDEQRVGFSQELDAQELVDRIASISFVAAASEPRRSELEAQLRALAEARGGRVEFRYVTSVYVTRAA